MSYRMALSMTLKVTVVVVVDNLLWPSEGQVALQSMPQL